MLSEITNRKLSLLTDFYELLMMEGYFDLAKKDEKEKVVTFDVFYRNNPFGNGFSVFCGLSEIIDYLTNLHFGDDDIKYLKDNTSFSEDFLSYLRDFRFTGSLYAFEEGSVINKKEPIVGS